MKAAEVPVVFQPSGRRVFVLPGTSLVEAAGRAGLILQTPCGGQGTCGKCRVRLVSGAATAPEPSGRALTRKAYAEGYRLACHTRVDGELVVEVPPESMFESRHQILVNDAGAKAKLNPIIRKTHFDLPPASREDHRSDLERLRAAVGPVEISHDLLRALPGFLRANGWKGTAVTAHRARLLALEPGNTTASSFGVAFDIGTTTVVGTLIDLTTGREVAVASRLNPQISLGDDVLTRILHARQEPEGLTRLQSLILGAVREIIGETTGQAGVATGAVYEVVIAGNSTMQQILCGIDPSPLGEVPFVQAFESPLAFPARKLDLPVNPAAEVFVFSQIGGFVGGDTTAGMVAARLDRWHEPVLLVDIGTNGELVLATKDGLFAASTAAGPAFEGARIRQGMRATSGAIEKVLIQEGELLINVIGNARPTGLCGTALIDTVAELLRAGLVDSTGRIVDRSEAPAGTPPALLERLVEEGGETNFLLAPAGDTASGAPILLWQRDVRELQLAAGAIRAGINILLRRAGVAPEALGAVLLAGAFGNFIRRNNARRIGLLPQIPCSRIRFIGNAASLGAKLALLAEEERAYAEAMRKRTRHVDLSLDAEFQNEFSMAMLFPDGDAPECEPDSVTIPN
jgi:uncharacterized 2Fe-2S/4Fe-4S cluster protein (DUF4445 family)